MNVVEFEKLQEIIAGVMDDVSADEITPETRFVEDLAADSLDVLQIITEIEDTFDIHIEDGDADKIKTIQDAVDQIKKAIE